MKIVNSQWYRVLELLSNLLILNFLWLITCLPVITIFPATSAMFSVIRRWKRNGESNVLSLYFYYLKHHFKQSFFIGILWVIFFVVLYLDFQLFVQIESNMVVLLLIPMLFIGLIFLFTTLFLFPMMSHYRMSWKATIKNSFILSFAYFPISLLNLIIVIILSIILIYLPITIVLVFGIGSYLNFHLCYRVFVKVDQLQNTLSGSSLKELKP
ncbi:YesL family protein [Gracilibacillus sp. D59]|uniref:YesL family protein n=1 Tax=Gracilibacillus sp. D59 TaxID=3457434 RepID=UPI003FCE8370